MNSINELKSKIEAAETEISKVLKKVYQAHKSELGFGKACELNRATLATCEGLKNTGLSEPATLAVYSFVANGKEVKTEHSVKTQKQLVEFMAELNAALTQSEASYKRQRRERHVQMLWEKRKRLGLLNLKCDLHKALFGNGTEKDFEVENRKEIDDHLFWLQDLANDLGLEIEVTEYYPFNVEVIPPKSAGFNLLPTRNLKDYCEQHLRGEAIEDYEIDFTRHSTAIKERLEAEGIRKKNGAEYRLGSIKRHLKEIKNGS